MSLAGKGRFSGDLERGGHYNEKIGAPVYVDETGAVAGESFAIGDTTYAKLQRFVGKFGVEQRGIERVPENERTDTHLFKIGTMWLSANLVISAFAIGALAVTVFQLGFIDAVLTIFFINILGITPVAFYSTFGARFGLRQMVLSRFYFGYYGVKLIAFFNLLSCLGWSSVNVIVGSQLINAVNPNIPGYGGIIIIAICTFFVTVFGYKIVHRYEYFSWMVSGIIFLIVLGQFARSGAFTNIPMGSGPAEIGSVLSFASSIFGFATGWCSYAADYTVYQPVNTSRVKIFLWSFAGLMFPLCFTQMLGVAVATAYVYGDATNPYTAGYDSPAHIGGLLGAVLFPPFGRFGEFCLVVLGLTIIANNCPNIYTLSLTLQVMARWTQAVPRFIWVFVGSIIYCAIAIPGYDHFEEVLQNFMLMIGYWLAIYEGVAITDHVLFKRGMTGYDVTIYNTPTLLPPGVAAVTAFFFGILGAVMGMSQVWFIGPIGKLIGDPAFGGDVGFELAFSFAAVSYIILRTIELKMVKR